MEGLSVLPFTIGNLQCAVPLENVVKVLPALLNTPLPGAPESVCGLVNLRGQVLPVIDLSGRFGLHPAQQSLWQPLIWLKTSRRELLLSAESVAVVLACEPESFFPAPDPRVPSNLLHGVVRSATGMLLIQDVEQLLSAADEQRLAEAMAQATEAGNESV
ncbi:chemotaxis protein CheW [Pseudomonas sp. KSR10]|nr:chemotaxis protein CheW [Pseudomonas sp. KSR10]